MQKNSKIYVELQKTQNSQRGAKLERHHTTDFKIYPEALYSHQKRWQIQSPYLWEGFFFFF